MSIWLTGIVASLTAAPLAVVNLHLKGIDRIPIVADKSTRWNIHELVMKKKFELKKNQFNLKFNSIYCSRFLISLKKYLSTVGVEPETFHVHNCDADHLAIRRCLKLNFIIYLNSKENPLSAQWMTPIYIAADYSSAINWNWFDEISIDRAAEATAGTHNEARRKRHIGNWMFSFQPVERKNDGVHGTKSGRAV